MRFSIPFTEVTTPEIVHVPRCKNCHERESAHLEDTKACLFSPTSWEAAPPNIVDEPYTNDIRNILAENSIKEMMAHEDASVAYEWAAVNYAAKEKP